MATLCISGLTCSGGKSQESRGQEPRIKNKITKNGCHGEPVEPRRVGHRELCIGGNALTYKPLRTMLRQAQHDTLLFCTTLQTQRQALLYTQYFLSQITNRLKAGLLIHRPLTPCWQM